MGPLGKKIQKLLFDTTEDSSTKNYRTFIIFSISIILMVVLASIITFFTSLKGKEQTMVPDVVGLKLENALIEIEEKALYSGIQLKFTQNLEDKGLVVEQDPAPGTSVKAESRVILKVSKGSAVETLENYVGWNINDLEAHINSMVSIYGPLLSIKKPIVMVYDESPAGTILVQKPESGVKISTATEIELVVSKGPFGQMRKVSDYSGLSFSEVLKLVANDNIRFVFTKGDVSKKNKPGTIISQSPAANTEVPKDTVIQFVISDYISLPDDYVFGILERTLPDYEVAVTISVEVQRPNETKKQLFSMKHSGGLITIPYLEPEGTILTISVAEKEIINYSIKEGRE